MDRFVIEGGKELNGSVVASGAKNAVLPILAGCVMAEGTSIIHNVPDLQDVRTMIKILEYLGAKIKFKGGTIELDAKNINRYDAPYEFVKTMRASIALLGPLIARFGKARFSLPGGCVIGPRPIDLHIKGLQKLGVDIKIEDGYIVADAKNGLKGNYIFLGGSFGSSVLATANVMCAATLAKGTTVIEFAACEPEITDLANFLVKMGAKISGIGSPCLTIFGTKKLKATQHKVIPDRIETGTFLLAGAITGGCVSVEKCQPLHLGAFFEKLIDTGVEVITGKNFVTVKGRKNWKSTDVVTLPYPGFPTDLQAQMMAFLTLADGVSVITEKVFPERFIHAAELNRFGASINLDGSKAIVKGVKKLFGARVMASDLRASAALVLAGLAAEGTTYVSRIYHLFRGYENFEEKLRSLGAEIKREKDIT
ncbi:MAG: UDP-N-acetylglucosamine 1-carboxyvinyltransferase [Candidatus Omnitrophica bacterium]|nr:UDP-N-acetylglucosamine 1-carboxyvinyltransferase [Candidatus Omnitrophota bacterium]MCM8817666.1 UDP-N-acetylglucosamine 1-carboxyvinyltransferase [Candidatus Omnitrophota bacterium]